ncbi:hypothetical protein [Endozoicomonas sp. ONNA1]|uniref:hypothetical protein n=1 Tax=Endozoicomonas sp. ONNA1 TaxID=2828740 RepID=UPI0021486C7E|nr:hypothetical protein [Endozoicomonas sp. ONNA1]
MFNNLILNAIISQLEPELQIDAQIVTFMKNVMASTKHLEDSLEIIRIWLKSNYAVDMKVEIPEIAIWINGVEVSLLNLPDFINDQQKYQTGMGIGVPSYQDPNYFNQSIEVRSEGYFTKQHNRILFVGDRTSDFLIRLTNKPWPQNEIILRETGCNSAILTKFLSYLNTGEKNQDNLIEQFKLFLTYSGIEVLTSDNVVSSADEWFKSIKELESEQE